MNGALLQVIDWNALDETQRSQALARPVLRESAAVTTAVIEVVACVRRDGDAAVRRYGEQWDGVRVATLRVSEAEFSAAEALVDPADLRAIEMAIGNVRAFHAAQQLAPISMETQPGVRCERLIRPIGAVGLYVPAGSAPLPSTAIMLAVPALLAGCARRVMCTPPGRDGQANAAVLAAARRCGVTEIYKLGGAQAIAAMAYGTESVPKVAKIFGPGNAWVTAAKQLVAADSAGAALDMPAGPSEVMVIADDSANAEFVASDLLAQCEHDAQAQAILVTTSAGLAKAVQTAVDHQVTHLTRQAALQGALSGSRIVLAATLDVAMEIAERYAPEHLIIETREPRALLPRVHNAGSVFLGEWSPEPMGDYCSGTNHVLPTYGYARSYSGLSLHDFTRRMTVQELSPAGLAALGPTAARLARLEGLDAHAAAVDLRLARLLEVGLP